MIYETLNWTYDPSTETFHKAGILAAASSLQGEQGAYSRQVMQAEYERLRQTILGGTPMPDTFDNTPLGAPPETEHDRIWRLLREAAR